MSHFLSPLSSTSSKHPKPPPIPITHVSLRILCHASLIGAFIGKSGSSIKHLQLTTGSKIRVEDSPPSAGSDHRVILITTPSDAPFKKIELKRNNGVDFEVEVSGFQEAAVRVFEKVLEVSGGEGTVVVCRVVVEEREGGVVIGKGGKIVKKLRRESGAKIRVLVGDQLPCGVSAPNEVVEIEGDAFAVKKALLGVCGQFQEYRPVETCSIQDSWPLESTSHPAVHNFRVDPLNQTSMQSARYEFRADPPLQRTQLHPAVYEVHVDALHQTPMQPVGHNFHTEVPHHRTPLQPAVNDFGIDPLLRTPQQPPLQNFRADGASLSVPTTSSTSMMARPLVFEVKKNLTSDSKPQREEVVFRILCSNDRVGGVIGRGGTIIKALQDESGANINVGSPVADCDERLITVSSKENVKSKYSPAQRAVVLVFCKSIGAAAEKGFEPGLHKGSTVSARLLVPSNQVGCLLGKGGIIISEMRKITGASIHIVKGDQVSKCAAPKDKVVEISGQFVNTQDALYQVTSKLRNHLITSKDMTSGTRNSNVLSDISIYGKMGNYQSSGTFQFIDGQDTSTHDLDCLGHPAFRSQLSETAGLNASSFVTSGRGLISANGVEMEHARTQRSAIVTNTKVEILIPESAISSVYGKNGNNLTRIRQISGAEVNVQEAVPGTNQRTVVFSGTPDETQAAQSLLHAFILTGSS